MKIAVFQMDVTQGAVEWNLDKASLWVEGLAADTDIAVLPEMFDGGGTGAETVERMRNVAVGCGKAICFTTKVDCHNRFCFVRPNGKVEAYDKRHLYINEGRFVKGEKRIVVDYRGMRILPQICYDLRFPVWSRNEGSNPYDIAIYLAAWPIGRIDAWDILLRARAIENICYVVGANRVGYGYPGHSKIVDFRGETMKEADPGLECTFWADLTKAELDGFRSKFCTFDDQDKFCL